MARPLVRPEASRSRPRRWVRAGLGGWAAIVGGSIAALGQGPRPSALTSVPTITLVGVVGDSIHGGPLAGAVILLDGQSREAVTDSIGRFRIDSVAAGFYRVGIFHPILDSLGTSLSSRPVQFRPGKRLLISMSTPSGRTLRRAICPELRAHVPKYEHADSGVALVVGRVLEADTDAPVPDATVTLSWTETTFTLSDVRVIPYQRTTTTDQSGDYRFCAVPSGLTGLLRASVESNNPLTVERELDLENRIVTMATVHLAAGGSQGIAASPAEAELTGDVQRPDGTAFVGAIARVEGTPDSVVTGSDGTFTIRGLPPGTHMVVVQSVGFEPVADVVELTNREPQHVSMALATPSRTPSPALLRAERLRAGYARVGFDRRRQEAVGQFLTAEDIAAKHARVFSELLDGMVDLQSSFSAPPTNLPSASQPGASCTVYVLDGHPFNQSSNGELDALYRPDEIAGIEVYNGVSAPPQFRVPALPSPVAPGAPLVGGLRPGSRDARNQENGRQQGVRQPSSAAAGIAQSARPDECTTLVVWTKAHFGVE